MREKKLCICMKAIKHEHELKLFREASFTISEEDHLKTLSDSPRSKTVKTSKALAINETL